MTRVGRTFQIRKPRQVDMRVAEVGDVGRVPKDPESAPRPRRDPLPGPAQLAERLYVHHVVVEVRRDVPVVERMASGTSSSGIPIV